KTAALIRASCRIGGFGNSTPGDACQVEQRTKLLAVLFKLAVSAVRLQLLAGFESNRLARRDRNFFARARVATYATLARLHDKDPKPAQLDPVAARQS